MLNNEYIFKIDEKFYYLTLFMSQKLYISLFYHFKNDYIKLFIKFFNHIILYIITTIFTP